MKAFHFRLQAVFTLREQAEHEAQQLCARACAAVESAQARLQSAEAAIAAADDLRRTHLAAGARASQLEQMRVYAVLLQERRAQVARELAEARRRDEEARRQLLAATQKRESLERLRGKQRRAYDYEAARAEQKVLDELSGQGSTLAEVWRQAFTHL
jgi:flagellar export protein FliJ